MTLFAYKTTMTAMYSPEGVRWGVTVLRVPELKTLDPHKIQFTTIFGKTATRESRQEAGFLDLGGLVIGDYLNISGISKGKGFAGGVKRWGFAGGPRTHGQSDRERAPGASSSGTNLGRVIKGKHMAGRMGNDKIMIKNLQVVAIDLEKRLVTIKGSVPGTKSTLLTLSKTP